MERRFHYPDNSAAVKRNQIIGKSLIWIAVAITVAALVGIIGYIIIRGAPGISLEFLTSKPKGMGNEGGILPMIINTLYLVFLGLLFSVPLSVGAAIYLTEYAKPGKVVNLIRRSVENLSGIPSIIFGLFGFIFFGKMLGLSFSLINGSLTVAIVILPTLIRTAEEAIRSVPDSYREGSLALGATKWQTIVKVVLPSAAGGILSGILLGMGRIVGETAALYLTLGSGDRIATSLKQSARSLSLHLYTLAHEGISREKSFATATVLIVIILLMNLAANAAVERMSKKQGDRK